MKVYTQIMTGAQTVPTPGAWFPWVNCEPGQQEQIRQMAVHQYLRQRGGLDFGQEHTFSVASYDDETPCYPNGQPMRAHVVTYIARREAA